jgi:hypothetical protein
LPERCRLHAATNLPAGLVRLCRGARMTIGRDERQPVRSPSSRAYNQSEPHRCMPMFWPSMASTYETARMARSPFTRYPRPRART